MLAILVKWDRVSQGGRIRYTLFFRTFSRPRRLFPLPEQSEHNGCSSKGKVSPYDSKEIPVNKVIACLIAVVAALIVALVLLNRQLTPPTAPAPAVSSSQPSSAKLPDLPDIGGSREPAAAAPEVTGTGKTLPPLPDSLEIGDPGIHRAPISNTTVTDGEGATVPSPTTDQASEPASSGTVPPAGTQTDSTSEPQQASAGSESAPAQASAEPEPAPAQASTEEKTQEPDIPTKPGKTAQAAPAVQQKPRPAAAQTSAQREKKDTAAKHEQPAQKAQKQPREKPARERAQAAKAEKPAEKAAAGTNESAQDTRRTGRVTVLTRNGGATVRLSASDEITYKHMILTQPDRFVIDLTGRWDVSTDAIPSNPLVTNIRLGRFKNRTRVVIDMTSQPRNAKVNLSKNRCRLDVRVDR